MPCPISEWFAITVTRSSAAMRTNAFGANTFPAAAAALLAATPASSGTQAEIQRPPLTAALVFRKSRRPSCCAPVLIVALMTASFLRQSPPHDGWPCGFACMFRSGKCFRSWPHQYPCPSAWRFAPAARPRS